MKYIVILVLLTALLIGSIVVFATGTCKITGFTGHGDYTYSCHL